MKITPRRILKLAVFLFAVVILMPLITVLIEGPSMRPPSTTCSPRCRTIKEPPMPNDKWKQALLVTALLGAGYVAGAVSPPTASAFTNEERIGNRIVTELAGIRRSLDAIKGKLR